MSDYDQFIKSAGITGTAFTRSVRESFPAFSKITKSMVCHPESYGMMLTPEAEAKLVHDFGGADGTERKTDFIDCSAWRKTAEFTERWFHKGSLAVVVGRIAVRDYKDREGNARRATEVQVENIYFGESRRSAETEPEHPITGAASRPVDVTPPFEDLGDDDGTLPF